MTSAEPTTPSAARTAVPAITRERRRGKDVETSAAGGTGTSAPLRPGNWARHQQQTVAATGFTVPQRAHDARCGGRCNAPPQALQNLASAGLPCSQYGHRIRDMYEHCRAVQSRAKRELNDSLAGKIQDPQYRLL